MSDNQPVGARYKAFISYRHADNVQQGRQWATWLQHVLETYEVPEDLVGKPNQAGEPIPARIYPVFRDEADLPADSDLESPIYRALDASDRLIVICSPRAVESKYVANEIRYYKKIGRASDVLAVIIDGEPNSSRDAGKLKAGFRVEDECFPLPLQHEVSPNGDLLIEKVAEPIAADLRVPSSSGLGRKEEGWTSAEAYRQHLATKGISGDKAKALLVGYTTTCNLMKLKIIAGVLGVDLTTLSKRDKEYQLEVERKKARTLRLWLTGVGILLIFAVLAGSVAFAMFQRAEEQRRLAVASQAEAVTQRDIAENQRGRAQNLVNAVLFDLRDQLEPVGRLALLETAARSVLDYYKDFEADHPLDGNSKRLKAVALTQVGRVLMSGGKLEEAASAHQISLELCEELVDSDPANADWQLDLAIGYTDIGDVEFRRGRLDAALTAYRKAEAIAERQVVVDPSNIGWQDTLSLCRLSIGDLESFRGNRDAALAAYRQYLKFSQESVAMDSTDSGRQSRLCSALSRIGDVGLKQKDYEVALVAHQRANDGMKSLAALAPTDANLQFGLSTSYMKLGNAYTAVGKLNSAAMNYEEALEINKLLVALDASNAEWRHQLAYVYGDIGNVESLRGKYATSLAAHQSAMEILQSLALQDSSNVEVQRWIAITHKRIAANLIKTGRFSLASAELQKCQQVLTTMRTNKMEFDPAMNELQWELKVLSLYLKSLR